MEQNGAAPFDAEQLKMKAVEWTCDVCGFLLGYLNPQKTELRIKYKDLFVYIGEPLWVRTICRKCGAPCLTCDEARMNSGDTRPEAPN